MPVNAAKFSQNSAPLLPQPFLDRMEGLLGEEYPHFLSSLSLPAVPGLRVNTLKISTAEFYRISPFELSPVAWCPEGYAVSQANDSIAKSSPGKHVYHTAGLYYLQEPSAMAAAAILSPQPGEKILDISAAPGGKASHLAAIMQNTGLLVANEIHPKRVWDLAENLERCGVTNAVVTNETPKRLAEHFGEFFDRVLLDAPCSGEGMFRKSQVARSEWKPGLVQSCSVRQSAILEEAARLVRPGGYVAYTTCTFSPDEDEGVVAKFLTTHPEFDLAEIQGYPGFEPARPEWVGLSPDHHVRRAVRLWPHRSQGEGHFVALFVKQDSTPRQRGRHQAKTRSLPDRIPRSKITQTALSAWDEFCIANLMYHDPNSRLLLDGSYLYLVPEGIVDLAGIQCIRRGLWLGSFNKGRFVPSHSLAMALKRVQAKQALDLEIDDRVLAAYLAGESISNPGEDGWVMVTVAGFPVGWGKRVQNVIKNFYPHGLRRRLG